MPKLQCRVRHLVEAVATIAPPILAEDWDNVGLQVGDPSRPVRRVMTCLELTGSTLREAIRRRADAIVAHHPLIYKLPAMLDLSQPKAGLIAGLIRAEIALIAAHTNLDSAAWSTNTVLAEACGLEPIEPLIPQTPLENGVAVGLGLLLKLKPPQSASAFAAQIKKRLRLVTVRLCGPVNKKIRRLAICTGGGGSLIPQAAERADAYLTGEINYHQAVEAHARGLAVIELGHFETEAIVAAPLAERLAAASALAGVQVFPARKDLQPFSSV